MKLRNLGKLGVVSRLALSLLAACGGNKQSSGSASGEQVFTRMEGDVISSMDAASITDAISGQALVDTMDCLYRYNGKKLEPAIATKLVKATNDGKTYKDILKEVYGSKREGKLSKSAMETLAIIAYSQPITRAEIEQIRGVGVDNMIRLLIERNLIREVGKKEAPGRPVLFGTTKEFLKLFRLNSISELPKLDEDEQERFELAR